MGASLSNRGDLDGSAQHRALLKSGYSLWFERPDIGVRLETLLEVSVGTSARDIAARALGASKSPAETTAVRANGAKGGRPRKKHAA